MAALPASTTTPPPHQANTASLSTANPHTSKADTRRQATEAQRPRAITKLDTAAAVVTTNTADRLSSREVMAVDQATASKPDTEVQATHRNTSSPTAAPPATMRHTVDRRTTTSTNITNTVVLVGNIPRRSRAMVDSIRAMGARSLLNSQDGKHLRFLCFGRVVAGKMR